LFQPLRIITGSAPPRGGPRTVRDGLALYRFSARSFGYFQLAERLNVPPYNDAAAFGIRVAAATRKASSAPEVIAGCLLINLSLERNMKATLGSRLAVSLMVAAFGLTIAPLTSAQDNAATTATGTTQTAPATKAEKKAARKQARAKKNAELKKLEDAGYNPAKRDDANYPQDIQNAQKKAGIGAGASQ
jgi:hypothetical protein